MKSPIVRVLSVFSLQAIHSTSLNITDQEIWVAVEKGGRGEFDFKIELRDSAGIVPAETKYYRAVRNEPDTANPSLVIAHGGGMHLVEPHQSLTDSIQLDKLYDLSKPDKYTIQLERIDDRTNAIVKSNKITLTVTP